MEKSKDRAMYISETEALRAHEDMKDECWLRNKLKHETKTKAVQDVPKDEADI